MIYEKICELVLGTEFEGCINIDNGTLWLRYDTTDSDLKERWDNFVDVQERLRQFGVQLDDVLIEHDCISGNLIKFNNGG
jgi:hypothetical protein